MVEALQKKQLATMNKGIFVDPEILHLQPSLIQNWLDPKQQT
jgi:hypothetical protein